MFLKRLGLFLLPLLLVTALPLQAGLAQAGAESGTIEPLPADLPPLALPLRCPAGKKCPVQFFPDAEGSSGFRDWRCGRTTRDKHTGTDIRVPTMADIRAGVEVLAAAPGTVVAIRDGEPDIEINLRGYEAVNKAGKGSGNLVILRHGEHWTSHYIHLRNGSVRARVGQTVATGDVLGLVGLSGNTNFPHLHFELRHRNRPVDPFSGQRLGANANCQVAARSLWNDAATAALRWNEVTLIEAGFSDRTPNRSIVEDVPPPSLLLVEAPLLAFWWLLVGIENGDRTDVTIEGPDGKRIAAHGRVQQHDRGYAFEFIGRRANGRVWPSGTYVATLRHSRGGRVLIEETRRVALR